MSTHNSTSEQSQVLFNGKKMGAIQGASLSGNLVGGEVDLGHGVDFTKTMGLTLDDVLALLKTITTNAPLRSLEATQKTNQAIAELKMKGGFHLIQHELQKALEPSSDDTHTIDSDSSNLELFERYLRGAIKDGDSTLTVYVDMPSLEKPERIINPSENLLEKLNYYKTAYDEDMRLIAVPEVRIARFEITRRDGITSGIEFNNSEEN